MSRAQHRIHRLMVVVAIVAMNLAVLRALFSTHQVPIILGGLALWLGFQIVTFRAVRSPGRSRTAWAGYTAAGVVMTMIYVTSYYAPHSLVGRACRSCSLLIAPPIMRLIEISMRRFGNSIVHELFVVLLLAAVWLMPFAVALVCGGYIARALVGFRERRRALSTDMTAST